MNENGKSFTESHILQIIGEVGSGLAEMHKKGMIHRDIKSDNVFVFADNHCKLGDLGLSKDLSTIVPALQSKAGTAGYMAPEVKDTQIYSLSADIYSLGVLAVVLCSGEQPTMTGLTQAQIGSLSRLSKETQELIHSMLNLDASKRPAISSIVSMPMIAERVEASLEHLELMKIKEECKEKDKRISTLQQEND
jgi:NIMA (never in mitosis gene a)-related kinase